jgi:hypothetical protein
MQSIALGLSYSDSLAGSRPLDAADLVELLGDELAYRIYRFPFYDSDDIIRAHYGIYRFDTFELLQSGEDRFGLSY